MILYVKQIQTKKWSKYYASLGDFVYYNDYFMFRYKFVVDDDVSC